MSRSDVRALNVIRIAAGLVLAAGNAFGWQEEAPLRVPAPGVVETILPPALHAAAGEAKLDVRVVGPEGEPRACELYWGETGGEVRVDLEPAPPVMEGQRFVWRATVIPQEGVRCRTVWVDVASRDYVGSVTIFGNQGGWKKLVENAAVYSTAGRSRTAIPIPPGVYEGFRLEFSAVDLRPVPLHQVMVMGERSGRSRVEKVLAIPLSVVEEDGEILVKGKLAGTGLWVDAFTVETRGHFSGRWSLERETVAGGLKTLVSELSGEVRGVGEGGTALTIPWRRPWTAKYFVVRLAPHGRYLGGVRRLTAKVKAEQP